jgi:hypothetical protein
MKQVVECRSKIIKASICRCGKIVFTEITGGTDGAKEMYEHMSRSE